MKRLSNVDMRDCPSMQVIIDDPKLSWFAVTYFLCKFFHILGTFFIYYAVEYVNPVHVLLIIKFAVIPFYLFIVPLGNTFKRKPSFRLFKYSVCDTLLDLLWFYCIREIGPTRTNIFTENTTLVIISIFSTILSGSVDGSKVRGTVFFIFGLLSMIFFDYNGFPSPPPEGTHSSAFKYYLNSFFSSIGLGEYEGGLVLVLLLIGGRCVLRPFKQKLVLDVGTPENLDLVSHIVSFTYLLPLSYIVKDGPANMEDFKHICMAIISSATFVFMLCRIFDHQAIQRLGITNAARLSTFSGLTLNIILSMISCLFTSHPGEEKGRPILNHDMSGGIVFTYICFMIATFHMTAPNKRRRADGLGIEDSSEILPLYGLSSGAIQRSQSFVSFVKSMFNHILTDRNSRTIFYFLCVNLAFTCVELGYGVWTNSLGLISDGFHMLFDCSALVMGLAASVISKWKPSKTFQFGYGRIEVLSGFVNGLFLAVIGFMVLMKSIERIIEPQEVKTEKLLLVAVIGLIINLYGIISFSQMDSSHGHGHSHGHGSSHGHSHSIHHGHSHNANMKGVFLHVAADAMGSIAVIFSSILIDQFGWLIADPICSFVVAILILASVFPLIHQSSQVLLLKTPDNLHSSIEDVITKILQLNGIVSCVNPRFWQHTENINFAHIKVMYSGEVAEQTLSAQISLILQEAGFHQVTVEMLKSKDEVLAEEAYEKRTQWSLGTIVKETNIYPRTVREI